MIYLDNAATTMQKPPEVYRAVQTAMETCASVGRSGHEPARNAADRVYACRCLAARLFDARPEEVCFTFNATHGLNAAIHSLVKPGDRVVISGYEHNAVLRPLHYLGADIVIAGKKLFAADEAIADFREKITNETAAVVCTHVSNVFGYVLPVEEIAKICRERNVPFILDASQSAGMLPVSLHSLGAAYIAMPGHKGLYGPQGTGILLCGAIPEPLLQGGTGSLSSDLSMPDFLPDRMEAGTHNVPGLCGLEAGLRFVSETGSHAILAHEKAMAAYFLQEAEQWENLCVYRGGTDQQSGVISFQIPGLDCEEAARCLADRDIAVRAGLHCAPLAHRSAATIDDGTVRISFSAFTRQEEISQLLDVLWNLQNHKILP